MGFRLEPLFCFVTRHHMLIKPFILQIFSFFRHQCHEFFLMLQSAPQIRHHSLFYFFMVQI